jgi:membrane complex biogenesis BtpA family protein
MPILLQLFGKSSASRPIIGMIHLRPLPGSAQFDGDAAKILDHALRDADALSKGGVSALMLENFGDVPFYPGRVPQYVVARMTAVAFAVRRRFDLPLGINVLRNDGQSALGIAAAVGAEFIRVNILCGARLADQGIISAIAHDLLRERAMLGAGNVAILADVDVKHSAPLAPRSLEDETADTIHRGLADGLIVSGSGTGKSTDPAQVRAVKAAAGKTPVFIGSGVSAATIKDFLPHADGFIVGTSVKKNGDVAQAVDVKRVRELVKQL